MLGHVVFIWGWNLNLLILRISPGNKPDIFLNITHKQNLILLNSYGLKLVDFSESFEIIIIYLLYRFNTMYNLSIYNLSLLLICLVSHGLYAFLFVKVTDDLLSAQYKITLSLT